MTTALDYMGNVKPSVKAKAGEVLNKVNGASTITHVWGYSSDVSNTEHHSGLAADFMVFTNKPLGDFIYQYLWTNRVRLGIQHIIWQQTITSTVVSPGVRRQMADRGNSTANHMDHVHVLFFDTAYVAPVVKPVPQPVPRPTPTAILRNGSTGRSVQLLQAGLNRVFPAYSHLATDGVFGPATAHVVVEFQTRSGIVDDGVVGPITRAKLATFGVKF